MLPTLTKYVSSLLLTNRFYLSPFAFMLLLSKTCKQEFRCFFNNYWLLFWQFDLCIWPVHYSDINQNKSYKNICRPRIYSCGTYTKVSTISCNGCSFIFFFFFGQDRNAKVFKKIVQFHMPVVFQLKDHRRDNPKLLRSQYSIYTTFLWTIILWFFSHPG